MSFPLVPWETPHFIFLPFLYVSVLHSWEQSRCPGSATSSPGALTGMVTRMQGMWLHGHFSVWEQNWTLRRIWAGSTARHTPLHGFFVTPNTEQWIFDKTQAPELWTLRLTPSTTNSCFPTSTAFPCFIYFNQELHNAWITQKMQLQLNDMQEKPHS